MTNGWLVGGMPMITRTFGLPFELKVIGSFDLGNFINIGLDINICTSYFILDSTHTFIARFFGGDLL